MLNKTEILKKYKLDVNLYGMNATGHYTYAGDIRLSMFSIDNDIEMNDLSDFKLLDINIVKGDMLLNSNHLKTLHGCPEKIEGSFNVMDNDLESLIGGPKFVGVDFDCSYNELYSLIGSPDYVGRNMCCWDSKLITMVGCPENVVGNIDVRFNEISSMFGVPFSVDREKVTIEDVF
jgi:hypothetical protein